MQYYLKWDNGKIKVYTVNIEQWLKEKAQLGNKPIVETNGVLNK